jgi:hypothetical protein
MRRGHHQRNARKIASKIAGMENADGTTEALARKVFCTDRTVVCGICVDICMDIAASRSGMATRMANDRGCPVAAVSLRACCDLVAASAQKERVAGDLDDAL